MLLGCEQPLCGQLCWCKWEGQKAPAPVTVTLPTLPEPVPDASCPKEGADGPTLHQLHSSQHVSELPRGAEGSAHFPQGLGVAGVQVSKLWAGRDYSEKEQT